MCVAHVLQDLARVALGCRRESFVRGTHVVPV